MNYKGFPSKFLNIFSGQALGPATGRYDGQQTVPSAAVIRAQRYATRSSFFCSEERQAASHMARDLAPSSLAAM